MSISNSFDLGPGLIHNTRACALAHTHTHAHTHTYTHVHQVIQTGNQTHNVKVVQIIYITSYGQTHRVKVEQIMHIKSYR